MSVRTDVSIIIPCYNRERFVSKAIESALEQRYVNLEVIVVDDGSSDRSWECISTFGSGVQAVRQQNAGVSAARNEGLRRARGRYVKFLDSDDVLPASAVAEMLHATTSRAGGERDIVFGDALSIGPDDKPAKGPGYGFPQCPAGGVLEWPALLSGIMSPWLPLYPLRALLDVDGFDEDISVGEDQELAIRLVMNGYRFVRVASVVAYVREHDGERLSRSKSVARYEQEVLFFNRVVQHVERATPASLDAAWKSVGEIAWIRGRDAARAGIRGAAEELFSIALNVGGYGVRPSRLRALYAIMSPYAAERLIEAMKSLASRSRASTMLMGSRREGLGAGKE